MSLAHAEFEKQAIDFLDDAWKCVASVLPTFGTEPEIVLNEELNLVSSEFNVPLSYSTESDGSKILEPRESDLFRAVVEYRLAVDRSGANLAVERSKFEIRVNTAPGIRFEFERHNKNVPSAHVHFAGVGGLLSPAMMRNHRKGGKKKGNLQDLHVPVGGPRFRPSLEDFLYFVVSECGFYGKDGWESRLLQLRDSWMDTQLKAAVRDNPAVAREALRALGYRVESPQDGDPPSNRHSGW